MNLHSRARTCPTSRALLVARMEQEHWSVCAAAAAAGVSRKTARKWRTRHRLEGVVGLRDRSSRPHRSPRRLEPRWEELILELRRARKTILQIAAALKLSRSRVARVLRRHGLSRLRALEPVQLVRRYEWARPGDMLHLDIKKLGRIQGVGHRITGVRQSARRKLGWDFVHVCVDDATRVAYVEVLADEFGSTTAGFFERAVAYYRQLGIRTRRVLRTTGAPIRASPSPMPAPVLEQSIAGPGPTLHGRMARRSASSSRCSASAPMPARTSPRPNDGEPFGAGYGTTTNAARTLPWALPRSPG